MLLGGWRTEVPLQPSPLRRGSPGGSYCDSNHSEQQEKGFTQQGEKPNWLCFIARPAGGRQRELGGEALFHNGLRGRLGPNYSRREHR